MTRGHTHNGGGPWFMKSGLPRLDSNQQPFG